MSNSFFTELETVGLLLLASHSPGRTLQIPISTTWCTSKVPFVGLNTPLLRVPLWKRCPKARDLQEPDIWSCVMDADRCGGRPCRHLRREDLIGTSGSRALVKWSSRPPPRNSRRGQQRQRKGTGRGGNSPTGRVRVTGVVVAGCQRQLSSAYRWPGRDRPQRFQGCC
jgi:hypothetical protein